MRESCLWEAKVLAIFSPKCEPAQSLSIEDEASIYGRKCAMIVQR
ncbi:hypothetical protein ATPR_0199 [Acetobacter tropicalis NBRC 101654]|uniref:Uncharacterized protein n=1 Tax=Acetobacter tropicalis NBRC 101654 TaxID=749388 RepID=F7VA00_9PROT|nr:hypothetical protein ATPR_0199 [Acetobacter tropicalis NBRC 101654]